MFEYNPTKVDNNTPKYLRLYSTYKTAEDGGKEEKLFANYINVWLWNIEIPSAYQVIENNTTTYKTCSSYDKKSVDQMKRLIDAHKATKMLDGQTSYFPVPSDYNFPGTGTQQIWNGALVNDRNKVKRQIWYTLSVKSYGEGATPKSYTLKLEYKDDELKYRTLGTFECNADGHEWSAIN